MFIDIDIKLIVTTRWKVCQYSSHKKNTAQAWRYTYLWDAHNLCIIGKWMETREYHVLEINKPQCKHTPSVWRPVVGNGFTYRHQRSPSCRIEIISSVDLSRLCVFILKLMLLTIRLRRVNIHEIGVRAQTEDMYVWHVASLRMSNIFAFLFLYHHQM